MLAVVNAPAYIHNILLLSAGGPGGGGEFEP
jgi:hypothetical protein